MNLLHKLLSGLGRRTASNSSEHRLNRSEDLGIFDRLLATLEATVRSLAVCEVTSGQALILPGMKQPFLHYVLKGAGRLRVENAAEIAFSTHTFIIVPAGRSQRISTTGEEGRDISAFERPAAMVDHMLRIASEPGETPEIITTCGEIEATYRGSIGMFDLLDHPIAVSLEPDEPLRKAFEALLDEMVAPRLGSRALAEALLKQCLVLLVRKLEPGAVEVGWLFGGADPRLVRAVLAMIDNPAGNFTLDGLANAAGMSRSSFAAQFQSTFEITPIDLLKRIRVQHAARLLESTDLPVSVIARSIGYESRTYFSRAFSEQFGVSPRGFRATRRT